MINMWWRENKIDLYKNVKCLELFSLGWIILILPKENKTKKAKFG